MSMNGEALGTYYLLIPCNDESNETKIVYSMINQFALLLIIRIEKTISCKSTKSTFGGVLILLNKMK